MKAPLPADEAERLETLRSYDILDTPPEAAFDRLTSLAAQIFDVPIALVSLVDMDRQWFKACFGAEERQTSREISFCAHAILSSEVMIVPDARLDPRFADNPSVTGTGRLRFYAGAPLEAPNGQNLGSLCLMDTSPRDFGMAQRSMLAELASIVVDEMELRRTGRELREREASLREALRDNSKLGTAVATVKAGVVITDPSQPDNPIIFANPGFTEATGYSKEEAIGRNCRFLQAPTTDPEVVSEIRRAIDNRVRFNGVLVNRRKDGTTFLNELSINPVFDEEGQLLSFVGLQHDVTLREQTKDALEQLVVARTEELAQSQIEILSRLARAAEFRDDDTGQHTQRVGRTAGVMAQALGFPQDQVDLIEQAAPLHDVGKIAISDLILLKPGKLTNEEYDVMKSHSAVGAALLSGGKSDVVKMAERIAGTHHERWDGDGYPSRLAGADIPLEGRITSVADVFDALTHDRPYRKAASIEAAVAEIARCSAGQFDPNLVEVFLTLPHADLV